MQAVKRCMVVHGAAQHFALENFTEPSKTILMEVRQHSKLFSRMTAEHARYNACWEECLSSF